MEDYDKLSAESKYLLAQFMKEFYSKIDEGQSRLQAKTIAITLDDVKELMPCQLSTFIKSPVLLQSFK